MLGGYEVLWSDSTKGQCPVHTRDPPHQHHSMGTLILSDLSGEKAGFCGMPCSACYDDGEKRPRRVFLRAIAIAGLGLLYISTLGKAENVVRKFND